MNMKMFLRIRTMSQMSISSLILLTILSCQKTYPPAKDITLLPLFTDNMVLQQKQDIPIWGTAEPDGEVVVKLNQQQKTTIVDDNGKWKVSLSPVPAGGPYELVISGEETHTIKNVMVGEVWVCSGQSNMEFYLINSKNGEADVAASDYPQIRLFSVKIRVSQTPQDQLEDGKWLPCSPVSSQCFSAVAYFFGRALHEKLKVPIGLINTSWGGTVAETWTSNETMSMNPDFANQMAQLKKIDLDDYARTIEKEMKERVGAVSTVDLGMKGDQPIWAAPDFDDSSWKTMKLPGYIEQNGLEGVDGIVWFRKEVEISSAEAGKTATLSLAKINDSDNTFLNGTLIGSNNLIAEKSRIYTIPAGLLKSGKNIITVQMEDIGGMGGIYGDSAALKLQCNDRSISLSGNWKYKVGLLEFHEVVSPNVYPTLLYNGMIHPLVPFGIRGAIWYQGESNAMRAKQYQKVFPDLIKDWRKHWNQGEFPFLFVQLANFMKSDSLPQESDWAELREAQLMTLSLPNTGMAVTIDIGDAKYIHPKNKQDVGKRLALNALAEVYGKNIAYSGPMYKSMEIEESKIRLQFNHTNNGLKIKGSNQLKGFAIAGADKKFVWADAKIEGNEVVVWNSKIKNPVAVRYAWAANPICNLFNGTDLPASPFRTDDWKGITYQ